VALHHGVVGAHRYEPSTRISGDLIALSQRAEGAQRHLAADPVEHDVDTFAISQLPDPSQEVLIAIVDPDRAEPLDHLAVAR
jgi:hypothetical protein